MTTPSPYRISETLLRQFEPQQSWLSHKSRLHGVDHMARVFILQELICEELVWQGIEVNRTATRYAAMAHDVGRHDDGRDLEHGVRSAAWMKENLTDRMSPEDLDVATYIVHWHVPPDDAAPVMTTELKVLKDADGLDRVRLGDLDVSMLRTDVAKNLVGIASELVSLTSTIGGTPTTFENVLNAAKQLGLVSMQ